MLILAAQSRLLIEELFRVWDGIDAKLCYLQIIISTLLVFKPQTVCDRIGVGGCTAQTVYVHTSCGGGGSHQSPPPPPPPRNYLRLHVLFKTFQGEHIPRPPRRCGSACTLISPIFPKHPHTRHPIRSHAPGVTACCVTSPSLRLTPGPQHHLHLHNGPGGEHP